MRKTAEMTALTFLGQHAIDLELGKDIIEFGG